MANKFDIKNIVLDKEEQWIEDNHDGYIPVENQEKMRRQMMAAASKSPIIDYANKPPKKAITLRLAESDIDALKKSAIKQGLPYQSLVSSILHKYVNDEFIEKSEAGKVLAAMS